MAETRTRRGDYATRFQTRLSDGAEQFVKAWKTQAKRPDTVGEFSYRGLELVHSGLGVAVRSLTRMEKATQLPNRPEKAEHHLAEAPARRPRHEPAHAEPAHHAAPAHAGTRRERHEPEPTTS